MASRTTRAVARTALAVVATAAVAGCSVYEDLTTSDFAKQGVSDVVSASLDTMTEVDSLRMTGQLWLKGRSHFVDLHLSRSGDCTGSLTYDGSHVDVRGVDGKAWVKGDVGFINTAGGGAALPQATKERLARSWIPLGTRQARDLCAFEKLFDKYGVVHEDDEVADLTRGEEVSLDGMKAVVVTGTDGGVATQRAWIATDDPHYVLKITQEGGREPAALAFSEFDQEFEVEPPPAKDVLRS
ncbi:hypothetical protein ASG88_10570 [Nocardioides sp. Soil777]|uniref:hypothetical protein n=1 Tax=Nocardioides sp. Soil777 TaxID=1736409 RepID=UPI000702769E|nr:hypothetical protein [Nocardioides sp. Soil777]KRF00856.1 hypothetical protein ASG88_10570 [Nocardioides sp. Soil777]